MEISDESYAASKKKLVPGIQGKPVSGIVKRADRRVSSLLLLQRANASKSKSITKSAETRLSSADRNPPTTRSEDAVSTTVSVGIPKPGQVPIQGKMDLL